MADENDPWSEFRVPEQPSSTTPAPAPDAGADPWGDFRPGGTAKPYELIPGTEPDKYRAAAIAERDDAVRRGIPQPEGYAQRAGHSALLGWGDELLAGASVPFEMIKRGTLDPVEAYRYTKAQQDLAAEKRMENTAGTGGVLADIAGGLATGAGVFGGARAAALGPIPASVVGYGRNVLKAGGLGAAAGSGEGNTFDERFHGAQRSGVLGLGVGAALPPVLGVAGAVKNAVSPLFRDPVKAATDQVAKVVRDSGVSMDKAIEMIANARASGQPFTLADALGKEGQRKLTSVAKVPGEARDRITDFLTTRDLNMPHRVGSQVGEALGAPGTAAQATTSLVKQASEQSRPFYEAAEAVPTWSNKLQQFFDDPIAKSGLAQGVEIQRLKSVGSNKPFDPTDAQIVGFDKAGDPIIGGVPNVKTINTLKVGLDKMIEAETNPLTGKLNARGDALTDFKNRMLSEIDALNPAYREARTQYRGPMEVKDAVAIGREMPSGGRHQDTIPAFRALPDAEQQGVRIGYADKVREQLERTGNIPSILREKVPKGVAELEELSLHQGPRQQGAVDPFRQLLNREEQMQRTSKAALGGPTTAENFADIAGTSGGTEALGVIGTLLSGQPISALRRGIEATGRLASGETEATRNAITDMLLTRDPAQARSAAEKILEADLRQRGYNPWTKTFRY